MSVSNSIHNADGDDRASLFDFMAPLRPNDHYFSTANLTIPAFADVSANSDAILSRPPADSNHQPSLERVGDEDSAPVPGKRKHSDVERDRRKSISNGFAVLQSILHNNPNAKPISKTILLQQACDEIRNLRTKLEAATIAVPPFGLENLFDPTPSGQQSSPPNPASTTYSPNTPGLGPDAFRDSRRSSTSTSTTGTLYNVTFSDHQKKERRTPNNKRTNFHSISPEGSEDDSINTASSSCGNMSDSEGSDSESELVRGAGHRSKGKDKSKKTKAKAREKERGRTGNRCKTKAFSNRSSPTSAPRVASPPLYYSPNREIQQAILSILLELPSHLEEVKKQRRLHPLPHRPETEELGDETSTKTTPPKRRHR